MSEAARRRQIPVAPTELRGFILLAVATNISLLRSYAPPQPCPAQQALGQLWDSLGTSFGTNKSIDVNSYDFCPRKIKKIFFRIVLKEHIRHVCCVSRYEYSTSVKEWFTADRRIERNVDTAVLAP